MLEWRLKAYRHWLTMTEPSWQKPKYPLIDYQAAYYYAAPRLKEKPKSRADVDPKLIETYEKLGIPLREQAVLAGVAGAPHGAVDAAVDRVSVAPHYRANPSGQGFIFRSIP